MNEQCSKYLRPTSSIVLIIISIFSIIFSFLVFLIPFDFTKIYKLFYLPNII